MWEFPGGKVELGEHPEDALKREMREEVGLDVVTGRIWEVVHHRYPGFEVVLLFYPCQAPNGQVAKALDVADIAWVYPKELEKYPLLPADAPLVERLRVEGIPVV